MSMDEDDRDLQVGMPVDKPFGYPFPGIVVARFYTMAGHKRYVVETTALPGLLHIFAREQLKEG